MGVNVTIVDPGSSDGPSSPGTILRALVSTSSDATPWVVDRTATALISNEGLRSLARLS
jgi:hypothetical protein